MVFTVSCAYPSGTRLERPVVADDARGALLEVIDELDGDELCDCQFEVHALADLDGSLSRSLKQSEERQHRDRLLRVCR